MNLVIAPSRIPFRWKGQKFIINKCGIENDKAYAEVEPKNEELEDELKRRIIKDNGLKVYLGLSYICFTEDYPITP